MMETDGFEPDILESGCEANTQINWRGMEIMTENDKVIAGEEMKNDESVIKKRGK